MEIENTQRTADAVNENPVMGNHGIEAEMRRLREENANLREALTFIAATVDTSQTCSPGNEAIAIRAMDALEIVERPAGATVSDRIASQLRRADARWEQLHRDRAVNESRNLIRAKRCHKIT